MDFTLSNEVKRDEIVKKLVEGTEEFAINRPGNRIVITGKGGTGKTTITAILSYLFAKESHVLAVDADPQMNLPYSLGMKKELAREIVPLNRHVDYIEEKTGARPGSGWGEFLSLNPDVSDVVDRFGIDVDERISLLVMGTLHKAAIGCLCPENDLLDSVVRHISLRNDDVILMDTEAGVEHFGRAIAKGFGHAIVVSDVSFNSVQVADSAIKLAWDLGIQKIHLVFNRVGSNESSIKDLLKEMDQSIPFTVDYIPYDDSLGAVDPSVTSLIKNNTTILPAVEKLLKRVQNSE